MRKKATLRSKLVTLCVGLSLAPLIIGILGYQVINLRDSSQTQQTGLGEATFIIVLILMFITLVSFGLKLLSTFDTIIDQISNQSARSANELALLAKKLSESSEKLCGTTTSQAAATQETASALDEISAMISKTAENSKKAETYSTQSKQIATKGKDAADEVIHSIEKIRNGNDQIMAELNIFQQDLRQILGLISEIGSKTKVINEIVFQTKLLSFNASVEAARAGENGKGFAVVAEEVGSLAQMSGNAAKEISILLDSSIQTVDKIARDAKQKMDKIAEIGKQNIELGVNKSLNCKKSLNDIFQSIESVNLIVTDITAVSAEQAKGIDEINKAISDIDRVSQDNSMISKDSATLANQLIRQAETLQHTVVTLLNAVQGEEIKHKSDIFKSNKLTPYQASGETKGKQEAKLKRPNPQNSDLQMIPSANDPRFLNDL